MAPSQLPAAAGSPAAEADPLGTGDGFVPAATWAARQDAYLAYATETVDLGSPSNVTAHLARSERDPGYDFDGTALQPDDLASIFAKIDALEDTSDFDMMRLTLLWWAYRDRLDPDTVAAIEQRFTGFRYWFTDPLPEGVVDDKWFWSENHRLIVHTLEYLSGRALPDATFDFTGEPGTVHAARGRERIEEWLDEKVAFGFSEWHSDVYYAKDIEPLLLLTEFAEDDIAQRAAAMLDMFLYDLAVHQRAGNVGVTHGRSYMKDKSRAVDQDVFNAVKLAFDTTSKPYTSRGDATVMGLARADRYRLPEAIARVARSTRTFVDRQHMGVPLDLDEPFTTTPAPRRRRTGLRRGGGAVLVGAGRPHRVADGPADRGHDRPVRPVRDVALPTVQAPGRPHRRRPGRDPQPGLRPPLPDQRRAAEGGRHHHLALGPRHAVERPGLPARVPRQPVPRVAGDPRRGRHRVHHQPGQRTACRATGWVDGDLYWNGGSTMPRSAQQGSALISMYAPQYASSGPPLDAFALPAVHPRLLPDRALRRGAPGRALDLRPQG